MTQIAQSLDTVIVLGPQGAGKSTYADAHIARAWDPRVPVIRIEPQHGIDTEGIALALGALAMDADPKPHNLYVDEADVFFSVLSPSEKKAFRNYWAVARHKGLQKSVFVSRRFVQIPIFVRASATQICLSARTRDVRTVKAIQELGGECALQSALPSEIANTGYYFQLCMQF